MSMYQQSLKYGVNFTKEPENVKVYEREQEDFKEIYYKTIEKLGIRYNILLNEKIRDIKLYCIQEFKKLESDKSNIRKGESLLKLDQIVKLRIRLINEWLKDMQFIWSFFRANNTGFVLEDSSIYIKLINEITTNKKLLQDTLNDIDREIQQSIDNLTEESRGGRRATQRKRTPRRRKVVQTRKKRY